MIKTVNVSERNIAHKRIGIKFVAMKTVFVEGTDIFFCKPIEALFGKAPNVC